MIVYAFPWWVLPFVWMGQVIVWAFVLTIRGLVLLAVLLGQLVGWAGRAIAAEIRARRGNAEEWTVLTPDGGDYLDLRSRAPRQSLDEAGAEAEFWVEDATGNTRLAHVGRRYKPKPGDIYVYARVIPSSGQPTEPLRWPGER